MKTLKAIMIIAAVINISLAIYAIKHPRHGSLTSFSKPFDDSSFINHSENKAMKTAEQIVKEYIEANPRINQHGFLTSDVTTLMKLYAEMLCK